MFIPVGKETIPIGWIPKPTRRILFQVRISPKPIGKIDNPVINEIFPVGKSIFRTGIVTKPVFGR